MRNEISVPSDWRRCATCTNWTGWVRPDAFCHFIQYDDSEVAMCAYLRCNYPGGAAACSHYQPRWR